MATTPQKPPTPSHPQPKPPAQPNQPPNPSTPPSQPRPNQPGAGQQPGSGQQPGTPQQQSQDPSKQPNPTGKDKDADRADSAHQGDLERQHRAEQGGDPVAPIGVDVPPSHLGEGGRREGLASFEPVIDEQRNRSMEMQRDGIDRWMRDHDPTIPESGRREQVRGVGNSMQERSEEQRAIDSGVPNPKDLNSEREGQNR